MARIKVWASLTGRARDRARHVSERFHLDPTRWYGTPEPVPCLPQLAAALWRDRRARIEYVRGGAAISREISPLGLVLASGHWYLLAHRDQHRRTYRVSRIRSVELLDEPATRPAAFDLAQTWAEARSQLEHENIAVEAIVRVEPSALPRLRQLVPVHWQERIPLICTEQIDLTIPFESENWACAALLSLGKDVEVLQPAAMRERVAAQARGGPDGDQGNLPGQPCSPRCPRHPSDLHATRLGAGLPSRAKHEAELLAVGLALSLRRVGLA